MNVLIPEHDAAHVNWGGNWRTPTIDEILELKNNCNFTESTKNNVKGYIIRSKTNGNCIFMPSGGLRVISRLDNERFFGYYMSNSLQSEYSIETYSLAGNRAPSNTYRAFGQSVRPVLPSKKEPASKSDTHPKQATDSDLFEWSDGKVIPNSTFIDPELNDNGNWLDGVELMTWHTIPVNSANGKYKCNVLIESQSKEDGNHAFERLVIVDSQGTEIISLTREFLTTTEYLDPVVGATENYFEKVDLDDDSYALFLTGWFWTYDTSHPGELIVVVVSKNVATLVYDGLAVAISPTDFDSDDFKMEYVKNASGLVDNETELLKITPKGLAYHVKHRMYKEGNILKITSWE